MLCGRGTLNGICYTCQYSGGGTDNAKGFNGVTASPSPQISTLQEAAVLGIAKLATSLYKRYKSKKEKEKEISFRYPEKKDHYVITDYTNEEDIVTTNDNSREIKWYTSDGKPVYYD
jgi:hypothetical protein